MFLRVAAVSIDVLHLCVCLCVRETRGGGHTLKVTLVTAALFSVGCD